MAIFADQSREAMRRQYQDAWRKFREQQPLTPLEKQIAAVIAEHAEYHALIERNEALSRDWQPEQGQLNPFLHLGMHLALREQVATDRPRGIADVHARLTRRAAGASDAHHEAEHRMMDALGTALWEAQRLQRPPDEAAYLEALRRLI